MAHYPTLKQLRYLCSVAEYKHFGRAAKACNVSQSTLSSGIQELEEHLDSSLLERNNNAVIITMLGHEVVERSLEILRNVDDLLASCEANTQPFSGKLRLGVIPTIAPFLLPAFLSNIRTQFPKLKLFIREEMSEPLVAKLQRGDLDLLLLALPFPAENANELHLFYDNFLLATPKQHPMCNKKHLATEDLHQQELLLLEDGHCLRDHALQACRLHQEDFFTPYEASSLNTIVQMVDSGIGVTLLPEMAVAANITAGTTVRTLAFDEENIRRSIGLMWRKKSPRSKEFTELGEYIKAHFANKHYYKANT